MTVPFAELTCSREAKLDNSVLEDVLLLLTATLIVVVGLRRLRLPLVMAFLLVGMVVGPHALGWVAATETTRTLAEFGVVFLLFALGLEFSLPRLLAMRAEVFTLRFRSRSCSAAPLRCPRPRSSCAY